MPSPGCTGRCLPVRAVPPCRAADCLTLLSSRGPNGFVITATSSGRLRTPTCYTRLLAASWRCEPPSPLTSAACRGVRTTADDVVICAGFSQGLALLCRVLFQRGIRRVAVENPCFRLHRLIIETTGLEAVPVPVSPEGLEVSRLAGLDDVGAVLLSPAHSYPSGAVLSAGRRVALLDWARDTGGLVIEDDYDAELRYDRMPVGALQGMDPARVAYGGTISKVLSPALRLGWIVVPASPDRSGDWRPAHGELRQ